MKLSKGLRVGKVADITSQTENHHGNLLSAIARSAEELTSGKGWPDGVIDLMADLGAVTGVSRVWIFQTIEVAPDYIIQDYPFEWAKGKAYTQLTMPKFNMFRSEINTPEYRELIESRKRGEWQSVVVKDLNDGWLKTFLSNQSVLSMLTIPILVEGRWWGTLGFDDCDREYRWSDVEISLLRTASFLISNAVMRDRLSAKTKQFEILQGVTESTAWELDLKKSHFWCSSEIFSHLPNITDNIHLSLKGILRLIHPDDRKTLLANFREYSEKSENSFRADLRIANECGSYVWVEVIGQMSRDDKGNIENIAGIAVDILQRKQEEEQLKTIAETDALTGISNRGVFDKRFSYMMNRFLKKGVGFSLLLLDIDFFKNVNDRWGHLTGDNVLKHVASICQKNLRASDVFARIGGEEFAILIKEPSDRSAHIIGERIRNDIENDPFKNGNTDISVSVSIGCGRLPCGYPVDSAGLFFKLTDYALYTAKNMGRNRLVSVDDLDISNDCRGIGCVPDCFIKDITE